MSAAPPPEPPAAAGRADGALAAAPGFNQPRLERVAGIGYWQVDRRQRSRHWNPTLLALHGLPPGHAPPGLQEWLQRFVHPDDRQRTSDLLLHWLQAGDEVLEVSLRLLRADGSPRQLLTYSLTEPGQEHLRFGVMIDVTPVHHAEQAWRQAAGSAALTASAIGLGTWQIDVQSGETRWDAPMWMLRGRLPRSDGLPTAAERRQSLHPDDVEQVVQNNLAGGTRNYEFRVVWPDGQVRWLAARSTVLHDEHGQPLRRIGVNWDITASREAETLARQREAALREADSRTHTLARMSHELRTPLNAILGCTHLLRAGNVDPAQQARRLAEIEAAGRELLALVDGVLDLTTRPPPAIDAAPPTPEALAPRVPPTATPPPTVPTTPATPTPGRKTVLYVEDNPVNAMIIGELVARRGDTELVVAETGLGGLALALERQPDLVLLDMQLPDISGSEVFRRLRDDARTAGLRCVAVSANAVHSDIDAALAAGMLAYWTKPLDFRAFMLSLDELLGPAPRA